ncbi:MAG: hypothetical protein ACPGH0_00515 [Opitutales bacterium]
MQTTIELPDSLLRGAKMIAAQQGQSMTVSHEGCPGGSALRE